MRLPLAGLCALGLAVLACNPLSVRLFERCPFQTPEPFWVEPVTAATDEEAIIVEVYAGNAERVTVVTETGSWSEAGQFSTGTPAHVRVRLVPDTPHHLEVTVQIAETTGPGGCIKGGYRLSTTIDKYGFPLAVVQTESER